MVLVFRCEQEAGDTNSHTQETGLQLRILKSMLMLTKREVASRLLTAAGAGLEAV